MLSKVPRFLRFDIKMHFACSSKYSFSKLAPEWYFLARFCKILVLDDFKTERRVATHPRAQGLLETPLTFHISFFPKSPKFQPPFHSQNPSFSGYSNINRSTRRSETFRKRDGKKLKRHVRMRDLHVRPAILVGSVRGDPAETS